jgi:hypothetical protein
MVAKAGLIQETRLPHPRFGSGAASTRAASAPYPHCHPERRCCPRRGRHRSRRIPRGVGASTRAFRELMAQQKPHPGGARAARPSRVREGSLAWASASILPKSILVDPVNRSIIIALLAVLLGAAASFVTFHMERSAGSAENVSRKPLAHQLISAATMLTAKDIQRSRAFYHDQLGFSVRHEQPDLVLLQREGMLLYLVPLSPPPLTSQESRSPRRTLRTRLPSTSSCA